MISLPQLLFHLILAVALLTATALALLMSIEATFQLRRWTRLRIGGVGSRRFHDHAASSRAPLLTLRDGRRAMRAAAPLFKVELHGNRTLRARPLETCGRGACSAMSRRPGSCSPCGVRRSLRDRALRRVHYVNG